MNFQNIEINKITVTTDAGGNQKTALTLFQTMGAQILDFPDSLKYTEQFRNYVSVMKFKVPYTPNTIMIDNAKVSYAVKLGDIDYRFLQSNITPDRQHFIFTVYNDGKNTRT